MSVIFFCHVVKCKMIQRKVKLKFTYLGLMKYLRFCFFKLTALKCNLKYTTLLY